MESVVNINQVKYIDMNIFEWFAMYGEDYKVICIFFDDDWYFMVIKNLNNL